MPFLWNFFFK